MLRLTKDPQSLIRAEAIQLLGETSDAKHAGVYLGFLDDRSYGVIDAAAEALARTKDPRAFDLFTKLLTHTVVEGPYTDRRPQRPCRVGRQAGV
jgi:HEAT repeat protein